MKVRIILEAKKDFGCTLKGNRMTITNEVFCPNTGIAFFPIDYKTWDVISYDQFTGFLDSAKKEVFNSDYVECECYSSSKSKCTIFGNVVFDLGCFSVNIIEQKGNTGYDIGQKIPLFDFLKIKIKPI
jgi:hypothetical protein